MQKSFVTSQITYSALGLMRKNIWGILQIVLVVIAILSLPVMLSSLESYPKIIKFGIQVFINIIIIVASVQTALKLIDNQQLELSQIVSKPGTYLKLLSCQLLFISVVILGLCIFILPGIIFAIRFRFYPYFIIEHGYGPVKALEKSWEAVYGVSWEIFSFCCVTNLILLLGVLFFGIGIFFALPLVAIMDGLVYRHLLKAES